MITIVRQPPKTFDATCRKCGTVFTYELSDVRHFYGIAYGDGVNCPTCGEKCAHRDQRLTTVRAEARVS